MALKDFPILVYGLTVAHLKPQVKDTIETLKARAAQVIWEDFRTAIFGLPPTPTSRGSRSRLCEILGIANIDRQIERLDNDPRTLVWWFETKLDVPGSPIA
jgi:hypothetical protein